MLTRVFSQTISNSYLIRSVVQGYANMRPSTHMYKWPEVVTNVFTRSSNNYSIITVYTVYNVYTVSMYNIIFVMYARAIIFIMGSSHLYVLFVTSVVTRTRIPNGMKLNIRTTVTGRQRR